MDSGTVAVVGRITGSSPPANAIQEAGSKSENSEKLKKIAEDLISKKRAGLTSKKSSKAVAQNSLSDESSDYSKSPLGTALEKATKAGFSVLKSTGLLYDFGQEASREIASTASAGGGADAESSEDGPSGLLQLFFLFSGLLLATAVYYAMTRKKSPSPGSSRKAS